MISSTKIKTNLNYVLLFLLFFINIVNFTLAQEKKENLNVFDRWIKWSNGENLLIHHLTKQAEGYLDLREMEIAELKTKVDWLKRQKKVKEILNNIVGPFPEKTPLNPRITGTLNKEGYKIELPALDGHND